MADPLIEQLRPLGLEKYAGRLTRIVSDAMQIAVGAGQIQKGLMRDEASDMLVSEMDGAAGRLSSDGDLVLCRPGARRGPPRCLGGTSQRAVPSRTTSLP
jgi:hypothetical protein